VSDRLVDDYPDDPEARELAFEVAEAETSYRTAMVLMILLSIFETPTWCNTANQFFDHIPAHDRCRVPGVSDDDLLLSNLPYIPPGWGAVMEVVIMLMIIKKLLVEYKLQSTYFSPIKVSYVNLPVVAFGALMVILEMSDVVAFCIYRTKFRIAFIARTGYICLMPAMRNLVRCIIAVVPDFVSIGVFLMGAIVLFSWVVITIFNDLSDIDPDVGVPTNKGFDTFTNTLNSLFVAGATDEFVGVFLTSYTVFRRSGLLWLLFLIVVQVLLLSLVLDTLVSAYQTHSEKEEEAFVSKKVKGVLKSFDALVGATGEKELSKASFLDFVREYSRSPRTRRIPLKTANLMFAVVDEEKDGVIDKKQFCNICSVMQYDFWVVKKDSPMKELCPNLWNGSTYQRCRDLVDCGSFDMLMNIVLVVNLLLVVMETIYDLNKWTETPLMGNLELTFAIIYVAEVMIKLSVWSFEHYWSSRSNQFDFFTTWTLLACSTVESLASSEGTGSDLKRYMNILRLFRLLRVVKQMEHMPAVQFMVNTIGQLIVRSKDILQFLGLVTHFFTMLSVQLWGGIFFVGNPLLKETEYKEEKYWVLNFNDFCCAFGVWVISFLCEYVPAFAEAVYAASPWPHTWLVFFIFYVFSVSIVFELVKAFTIEVFIDLNKKRGTEVKDVDALADIIKMLAEKGEYLHYRVIGDASANEKMMEALEELMGGESENGKEKEANSKEKEKEKEKSERKLSSPKRQSASSSHWEPSEDGQDSPGKNDALKDRYAQLHQSHASLADRLSALEKLL